MWCHLFLFRICLLTLAPSHSIYKEGKTPESISFQVDKKRNRLDNQATGKGKKVTIWAPLTDTEICLVLCCFPFLGRHELVIIHAHIGVIPKLWVAQNVKWSWIYLLWLLVMLIVHTIDWETVFLCTACWGYGLWVTLPVPALQKEQW